MKTKKNRMKCFFTIFVILIIIACKDFSAGSYPYAEKYSFTVSDSLLIKKIETFKLANETYDFKDEDSVMTKKQTIGNYGNWYYIYFYYPKEKQLVFTYVQSSGKNKSTLALVSIGGKLINKEFSSKENSLQKKNFKDRILNLLK